MRMGSNYCILFFGRHQTAWPRKYYFTVFAAMSTCKYANLSLRANYWRNTLCAIYVCFVVAFEMDLCFRTIGHCEIMKFYFHTLYFISFVLFLSNRLPAMALMETFLKRPFRVGSDRLATMLTLKPIVRFITCAMDREDNSTTHAPMPRSSNREC